MCLEFIKESNINSISETPLYIKSCDLHQNQSNLNIIILMNGGLMTVLMDYIHCISLISLAVGV